MGFKMYMVKENNKYCIEIFLICFCFYIFSFNILEWIVFGVLKWLEIGNELV